MYQIYVYFNKYLNSVKIICYDRKMYMTKILLRLVLDWYHFYPNHRTGSRFVKKSEKCTAGKASLRKNICMLSRARYVKFSELERLFMYILHPIMLQN